MKNVDTKNVVLAVVLTLLVVVVWEYFIGQPMQRRQQEEARLQQQVQQAQQAQQQQPAATPTPGVPGGVGGQKQFASREEAVAGSTQRVKIDAQRLIGSINLVGGLIDDVALRGYRETLDPASPNVDLFSPRGTPVKPADHKTNLENRGPYFAGFGWNEKPGSTSPRS